jgi:uncharacterized membrane protein YfcA
MDRFFKVVVGAVSSGVLFAVLDVAVSNWALHLSPKDPLYGNLLLLFVILGSALGATVVAKRSWKVIVLFALVTVGTTYLIFRLDR